MPYLNRRYDRQVRENDRIALVITGMAAPADDGARRA